MSNDTPTGGHQSLEDAGPLGRGLEGAASSRFPAPAENAPVSPEPPTPAELAEDEPEPMGGEAARYRRRLRESESQLAATREQLAGYQRREVERLASSRLAVPGDVFSVGGADLADFLDDDGTVNAEAVERSVSDLLATRPGLAPVRTTWPDMGGGDRGGRTPAPRPSWGDVVRGTRR